MERWNCTDECSHCRKTQAYSWVCSTVSCSLKRISSFVGTDICSIEFCSTGGRYYPHHKMAHLYRPTTLLASYYQGQCHRYLGWLVDGSVYGAFTFRQLATILGNLIWGVADLLKARTKFTEGVTTGYGWSNVWIGSFIFGLANCANHRADAWGMGGYVSISSPLLNQLRRALYASVFIYLGILCRSPHLGECALAPIL